MIEGSNEEEWKGVGDMWPLSPEIEALTYRQRRGRTSILHFQTAWIVTEVNCFSRSAKEHSDADFVRSYPETPVVLSSDSLPIETTQHSACVFLRQQMCGNLLWRSQNMPHYEHISLIQINLNTKTWWQPYKKGKITISMSIEVQI
jgi:hypothetical protein